MSWKPADLSLRGRMVFWSTLSAGVLTMAVGVAIYIVSHLYLYGEVSKNLHMLCDDLAEEHVMLDGATKAFFHCIDEDASEHDVRKTRIVLRSADGNVIHATPTLLKRHHEQMSVQQTIGDGMTITVTHDTEDIRRFLIFLASMFAGLFTLSTLAAGIFARIIGGNILKLNDLLRSKDLAYAELRTLTDDIAHDLRTPLTRLSMAAEAAVTAPSEPHRLPEHVLSETGSMLELINTMLEISQTTARINRTPRETLDLAALVRRSGELYSVPAEDAGIVLEVSVPDAPMLFSGHKGKLQQLIANLLENALKYTHSGGHVQLSLSNSGEEITLTVSDTGCGISENDLPHIFQRFWRADSSRHLPGNGLGLALVWAIVTSYGGTIRCSSAIGSGSKFTVTLPSGSFRNEI